MGNSDFVGGLFSESDSPLASLLSGVSSLRMITGLISLWQKLARRFFNSGIFEVLDYESTITLEDKHGEHATFKKHEKVCYLQDNVIAYQDQAWGDGSILKDYRCKPGFPVDRYRCGYKTHILISLREVKSRGDIDDFNIEWRMDKGFTSKTGFWATEISHSTQQMSVTLVFPKDRPPITLLSKERNSQKSILIDANLKMQLPDGRWSITWKKERPRQYEQYILQWEW